MYNSINQAIEWMSDKIALSTDSDKDRTRRSLAVFATTASMSISAMYFVVFAVIGLTLPAYVNVCYTIFSILLFPLLFSKHFEIGLQIGLILILVFPFAIQASLGGFVASGFQAIWALLSPVSALILLKNRTNVIRWFSAYLVLMITATIFDAEVTQFAPDVHANFTKINGILNISWASAVLIGMNWYFVTRSDLAQKRADDLLLNILPYSIARRLKYQPGVVIADGFDSVSILFADIVNFTKLSSDANPGDVVNFLNTIFSDFDELAIKYGLEKIKTIGDAYMVAGGLPNERPDHAHAIMEMGLEMLQVIKKHKAWHGEAIELRIGINTGSVVAGVIGRQKFIYDLWGDAVNVASRMESNGLTDVIQVTAATYQRLQNDYVFEEREPIFVKGKGEMTTYLVKGRKNITT